MLPTSLIGVCAFVHLLNTLTRLTPPIVWEEHAINQLLRSSACKFSAHARFLDLPNAFEYHRNQPIINEIE